jgi:hypothetical protein
MARRRAILTDREREILSGETDVDQERFSVALARVRKKINVELAEDIELLESGPRPELAEELRSVVCDEE